MTTDLGDFIRDQRRNARLSLRKLSEMAGISNPYLQPHELTEVEPVAYGKPPQLGNLSERLRLGHSAQRFQNSPSGVSNDKLGDVLQERELPP